MLSDDFDERRHKPSEGVRRIMGDKERDAFELQYQIELARFLGSCFALKSKLRRYSLQEFIDMLNIEPMGLVYRQVHELAAIVHHIVNFKMPCTKKE